MLNKEKWAETFDKVLSATFRTAGDVGEAARAGAQKAGQTAETVVTYTKIRVSIADLRAEVNQKLKEIGEVIYATHTGDLVETDAVETLLADIDRLKEEISEKERLLTTMRGQKVCESCGAENPVGHLYCSSCGQPLTVTYSSAPSAAPTAPVDVEPEELVEVEEPVTEDDFQEE